MCHRFLHSENTEFVIAFLTHIRNIWPEVKAIKIFLFSPSLWTLLLGAQQRFTICIHILCIFCNSSYYMIFHFLCTDEDFKDLTRLSFWGTLNSLAKLGDEGKESRTLQAKIRHSHEFLWCYFIALNIIHYLNHNNIDRLCHHKLPQVRALWVLLGL